MQASVELELEGFSPILKQRILKDLGDRLKAEFEVHRRVIDSYAEGQARNEMLEWFGALEQVDHALTRGRVVINPRVAPGFRYRLAYKEVAAWRSCVDARETRPSDFHAPGELPGSILAARLDEFARLISDG